MTPPVYRYTDVSASCSNYALGVSTAAHNALEEATHWVADLLGRAPDIHEQHVTQLAYRLATEMGLVNSVRAAQQITWSGILHDIGKSAIASAILNKPGPLSAQELHIMRQHPNIGCDIARAAPGVDREILGAILHHHERWDGSGYPVGLIGHEIPVMARVLTVVDVYDALVSDRPYRTAWSTSEAKSYLLAESGKIFQPELVELFVRYF